MDTHINPTGGTNNADSVHPFKVFKKKEYKDNDEGRLELCIEHVRLLSPGDIMQKSCKQHKNKWMSCNCLGFLNTDLYWEAAGNWMVDFGKMNTQDQQRVVIKKI
jgi:hypothetical protein